MVQAPIILIFATGAGLLIRYMRRHSAHPMHVGHLLVALGLGIAGVAAAIVIEAFGSSLFGGSFQAFGSFSTLPLLSFLAFLGVGLIEEFVKFFPFSRYVLSKAAFGSVTTTFTYFVIIGMTFGIVEDIGYAITYGSGTIFERLALGLFFHAGLTGLIGYYFARAYVLRESMRSVWIVFFIAAAVHGVYDYSLTAGGVVFLAAWALTIAANCLIFWLYYKANVLDYQLRAGQVQPAAPPQPAQPMQWTPAAPPQQFVPQQPVWPQQQVAPMRPVPAAPAYPQPSQPPQPAYAAPQSVYPNQPPAAPYAPVFTSPQPSVPQPPQPFQY